MRRFLAVLVALTLSVPLAGAQQVTVGRTDVDNHITPTAPVGTSDDRAVTTASVQAAVRAGGGSVFTPATYGAKCDGVSDDTAAFVALAAAATAAGRFDIELPDRKTCLIWPNPASLAAHPVLMHFRNATPGSSTSTARPCIRRRRRRRRRPT